MRKSLLFSAISILCITGCSTSQPEEHKTLRDIDIKQEKTAKSEVFVKPKTEEEIKSAYYNYIKNSSNSDNSRLSAINRLTELEMSRINDLTKNSTGTQAIEDTQYQESLRNTVSLMQTSLREFPNAKNNDKTMYQLAHTFELLDEHEQSIAILEELCKKYPASPYYAEAQFRIGETAFVAGDYLAAERAYTETILSSAGDAFYERSTFKRGWARYRQGYYTDAADDYLDALNNHNFGSYDSLSKSEKDQFDEYFRALGLSLASLPSTNDVRNYFVDKTDFKYLDHTYAVVSDIYLKQKRYADASDNLAQFITANPDSPKVPLVRLKMLSIWKVDEFKGRFLKEFESFYNSYNPKSIYWIKNNHPDEQKEISAALRDYSVLVAIYYQDEYQKSRNRDMFVQANNWYKNYLENYSAYAQQDKVYTTYGELLANDNKYEDAIYYFELAAYDGNIILNKEAAYATIDLSNKLYEQTKSATWLDKHIRYSLISAQLYPAEARYHSVSVHAAELAFANNQFKDAITLATTVPDGANEKTLYDAKVVKGLSYLKLEQYKEAEIIFAGLAEQRLDLAEQKKQRDNLALAIYQQAEASLKAQNTEAAIQSYARVAKASPQSEIAPNSLYEAIAQSMKYQQWDNAISYIQEFQKLYPNHTLYKDSTKQLSTAYLNSGQGIKAAQAFEKISAQDENQDVKMAALLKAAELYESKNNVDEAINSYQNYANTYPRPYPQYAEAMYKLTQLHGKRAQKDNA
ncbi:MAG: tetratricopeptide repeat protein, partial [Sphingobacteriales bacterium]